MRRFLGSKSIFSTLIVGSLLTSSALSTILRDRYYVINDGLDTIGITSVCRDIGEVLDMASVKLGVNDKVFISDVDSVITNVSIKRAVSVGLSVDGCKYEVAVESGKKVGDVLDKLGVVLRPDDVLSVSKDQVVSPNLEVVIDRVEYKTSNFVENIPFSTEKKETSSLLKGKSKVERHGIQGKKEIILCEKFVNGELIEGETQRSEKVLEEPISQVELVGTKVVEKKRAVSARAVSGRKATDGEVTCCPAAGTFVDNNGAVVEYEKVIEGFVTAYSPDEKGDTGVGSTGVRVKPGVHCAVNPRIIPYGSKLYIPGQGYRIAADTGGALMKGFGIVDMRVANIREANNFGKRRMKVYIVKKV